MCRTPSPLPGACRRCLVYLNRGFVWGSCSLLRFDHPRQGHYEHYNAYHLTPTLIVNTLGKDLTPTLIVNTLDKAFATAVPHFQNEEGEEVAPPAPHNHSHSRQRRGLVLLDDPDRSTPEDFFRDSMILFVGFFLGLGIAWGGIAIAGLSYPRCNDYHGWWSCFNNCPKPSKESYETFAVLLMGAGFSSTMFYVWGAWVRCSQAWDVPRCGNCCCTANCCCVHRSCLWKFLWKACCVYLWSSFGDSDSGPHVEYNQLSSPAYDALGTAFAAGNEAETGLPPEQRTHGPEPPLAGPDPLTDTLLTLTFDGLGHLRCPP